MYYICDKIIKNRIRLRKIHYISVDVERQGNICGGMKKTGNHGKIVCRTNIPLFKTQRFDWPPFNIMIH